MRRGLRRSLSDYPRAEYSRKAQADLYLDSHAIGDTQGVAGIGFAA
jgi:hypothetical protein